jgi:hypothetical protein
MQPRTLDFDPDTPIRIGPSLEPKLLFSLFAFKFRRKSTHDLATYTGVYISDLFEAFGADASLDVIGAKNALHSCFKAGSANTIPQTTVTL